MSTRPPRMPPPPKILAIELGSNTVAPAASALAKLSVRQSVRERSPRSCSRNGPKRETMSSGLLKQCMWKCEPGFGRAPSVSRNEIGLHCVQVLECGGEGGAVLCGE